MSLVLPNARLGVVKPIGMLRTPEGRVAIEVVVIDHVVTVHHWRHTARPDGRVHSEKFYTVEYPAASAEQMAELLHHAALKASRIGDSPMAVRAAPTNSH